MNSKQLCVVLLVALTACCFMCDSSDSQGHAGKPLMFGRTSCPYTVKMIDSLKGAGVYDRFAYIDVTTNKGKKLFAKHNGNGVPHFVNGSRTAVGAMDPDKLLQKLGM